MTDLTYKYWSERRDKKRKELEAALSTEARIKASLGRAGGLPK